MLCSVELVAFVQLHGALALLAICSNRWLRNSPHMGCLTTKQSRELTRLWRSLAVTMWLPLWSPKMCGAPSRPWEITSNSSFYCQKSWTQWFLRTKVCLLESDWNPNNLSPNLPLNRLTHLSWPSLTALFVKVLLFLKLPASRLAMSLEVWFSSVSKKRLLTWKQVNQFPMSLWLWRCWCRTVQNSTPRCRIPKWCFYAHALQTVSRCWWKRGL